MLEGKRLTLLLLLFVISCGQQTAAPTPTTAPTPTAAPAPTTAPPAANTFTNPVFRQDFPDPDLLLVGDTWYAYATNGSGANIQRARSEDLITWQRLPDALPALPGWAQLGGSFVWAPEVLALDNRFVMYFTARDKAADRQCIGVAVADAPDRPFRAQGDGPLVCQAEEGGSIDAHPFRDGEQLFLYWKNDGNCCGQATYIYAQPLAPDGLSLTGEPTRLVRNDAQWEGRVVEAPTMVRRDETYFLFFSGNNYGGLEYAVGYAVCETPVGPCEDAPENPILASKIDAPPLVVGPGHQDILEVNGETWIAYHAWEVLSNGTRGSRRFLWLDRIVWEDGRPVIQGPTTGAQPRP
jgi:beta-xylosidase